jgi:quercetin dioxygenase-like cupin family protein
MTSSAILAAATSADNSALVPVKRKTFGRSCSSFTSEVSLLDGRLVGMSAFGSVSALDLQRIWEGVHGRVVHGDRITLGVIELDAGSVIPEHRHENEQLGICLSGSLVFRVRDESRELRAGETWSIAANAPHEVQVGPEGAVVIDVFAPTRDDWREAPQAASREPRWP